MSVQPPLAEELPETAVKAWEMLLDGVTLAIVDICFHFCLRNCLTGSVLIAILNVRTISPGHVHEKNMALECMDNFLYVFAIDVHVDGIRTLMACNRFK